MQNKSITDPKILNSIYLHTSAFCCMQLWILFPLFFHLYKKFKTVRSALCHVKNDPTFKNSSWDPLISVPFHCTSRLTVFERENVFYVNSFLLILYFLLSVNVVWWGVIPSIRLWTHKNINIIFQTRWMENPVLQKLSYGMEHDWLFQFIFLC